MKIVMLSVAVYIVALSLALPRLFRLSVKPSLRLYDVCLSVRTYGNLSLWKPPVCLSIRRVV
jgi:hypothetical protein